MNNTLIPFTASADKQLTPIEQALSIDKDGFTTAKKLYKWLELDESNYSRWVKMNIIDNPFAEEGVEYSSCMKKIKRNGAGRPTNDYRLSASFAKRLAMMTKTERGEQARIYFLMCEKGLEQAAKQIRELELERAKGIAARRSLTDVIIESGENERMKGHGYSNYTDLAYKAALGKTSRQIREERGLDKKDNVRDYLTVEEVDQVRKVEDAIAGLLGLGRQYPEIRDIVLNGNIALALPA